MRIALILLLILYAVKAHTAENDDVLFLDLNNSPKEIEAARAAAKQSGRKLVVIPEISKQQTREYHAKQKKFNEANAAMIKACSGETQPGCGAATDLLNKAYEEMVAYGQTFQLNKEKFEAFLASRNGKPFSSVVISGHDGTGSFSGHFGSMKDHEIADALGKYPEMKESIRVLHLWGCYTTSPGSLLLNWKKNFPNTALITGYEGRAPLNDKPAGWHYLKGVLAKETELLKVNDSAKLQKLLKKIPGANQVHSAVYSCDNYASLKDHYNIGDLQHRCDDLIPKIEAQSVDFSCYMKAEEDRCADPPQNVGSGPVRTFYELLHKASACGEVNQNPIFRTHSRDAAIRLVFGREVQKNFANIYRRQLNEVDALLADLNAPADLRFAEIGSLTRQEMLRRADRLLKFLREQQPDPESDPALFDLGARAAKLISLSHFQRNLTSVMAGLQPSCVPFNWTEPAQTEKSPCVQEKDIGLSGVENLLANPNEIKKVVLGEATINLQRKASEIYLEHDDKFMSAETSARLELIHAKAERMVMHYRSQGSIAEDQLNRVKERISRAEKLAELTAREGRGAKMRPEISNIAFSLNQPVIEDLIKRNQEEIRTSQAKLSAAAGEQVELLRLRIESAERQLRLDTKALEAMNIIRSEATWDSRIAKTEALNQLELEIGRLKNERQISIYEYSLDRLNSRLDGLIRAGHPNEMVESIESSRREVAKMKAILEKAKNLGPDDLRRMGEDVIFDVRNGY